MKIPPRSKLVFIGDSITDCERARPVGEGLFGAVGKGYVAIVDGLLGAIHPPTPFASSTWAPGATRRPT